MARFNGKFACLVLLGSLAAGFQAQAQTKIGVFDPQRVSIESEQGKQLQTELSALQKQKQEGLAAKSKVLNALEQQFAEQALSLSTEKRTQLQLDIERGKLDLENARELASRELQLEYSGAQARFQEMLLAGVEDLGTNQGFDLILDTGAVAWAGPSVDVTTAIIDRMNRMFPLTPAGNGP